MVYIHTHSFPVSTLGAEPLGVGFDCMPASWPEACTPVAAVSAALTVFLTSSGTGGGTMGDVISLSTTRTVEDLEGRVGWHLGGEREKEGRAHQREDCDCLRPLQYWKKKEERLFM